MNLPKEIRWDRVRQRNNDKGQIFEIEVSEADFNFMEDWFEKPLGKELENASIISR